MSELVKDEQAQAPARAGQSGTQIWINLLLFIGVPVVLILIIKYLLKI